MLGPLPASLLMGVVKKKKGIDYCSGVKVLSLLGVVFISLIAY